MPETLELRQVRARQVQRRPGLHRGVERHHHGAVAGALGPAHQAGGQLGVARPVELEPARRLAHRRGHLLERHGGHRAQRERHADRRRGPAGGQLGVLVEDALDPHGRQQQRRGQLGAEESGGRGPAPPRPGASGARCASGRGPPGWRASCRRFPPRPPRRRKARDRAGRGPGAPTPRARRAAPAAVRSCRPGRSPPGRRGRAPARSRREGIRPRRSAAAKVRCRPRLWRNWQTRRLQVPVSLGMWRFESSQPHEPSTRPARSAA